MPLDTSDLLTAVVEDANYQDMFETELIDQLYVETLPVLSNVAENICTYIVGYVVRKLLPRLRCDECRSLLVTSEATAHNTAFLRIKNNGGLMVPSAAVIQVVEHSERRLRKMINQTNPANSLRKVGLQLEMSALSDLRPSVVFGDSRHGIATADGVEDHCSSLIRQIVRYYLTIRKYRLLKSWNLNQRGTTIRQKLTKLVLFRNQ
jgi:hypothetical protein